MSLINCPECKKEISDKAEACPQCGCPIKSDSRKINAQLKTIQLTSKKLKGNILFASILFWIHVLVICAPGFFARKD